MVLSFKSGLTLAANMDTKGQMEDMLEALAICDEVLAFDEKPGDQA